MAAVRNTLAAGSWLAKTQMKVCAEFSECRIVRYVSESRQNIRINNYNESSEAVCTQAVLKKHWN